MACDQPIVGTWYGAIMYRMPLAVLNPHPYCVLSYLNSEVQQLADSILDEGQRVPIWLDRDRMISDGHKRIVAFRRLGLTHINAVYRGDLPLYVWRSLERRKALELGHGSL